MGGKKAIKIGFVFLTSLLCLTATIAQGYPVVQDESGCLELLINHFRANFEDIHDVSMRFHHLDHRLNGLITFDMEWKEGRMTSFAVLENETGNRVFAAALGTAMKQWYIEEILDPCELNFSFRIKIVGSDDPSFSEKSIFTGEVVDTEGNPVKHARVSLRPVNCREDSVKDSRTSREGIFVRTLIPPGIWGVSISCPGYEDITLEGLEFRAGEHKREKVVLKKIKEES